MSDENSVVKNYFDGICERIRALFRCAVNLFVQNIDATDGEKGNKKLWRRWVTFVQSFMTRSSKVSPAIDCERSVFPRLELPKNILNFEYDMNHKNRGIAMIFNHEHFDGNKRRLGTDKDRDRLKVSLERFGFDVKVYNDLSLDKIGGELHEVSLLDHSENDCFFLAIMTHGDNGTIYTRSERYTIDIVTSFFTDENCPTLKGKPRLFFIQACRGGEIDTGHVIKISEGMMYKLRRKRSHGFANNGESDAGPENVEQEVFDSLHEPPNNSDFLIVRSTMPNYASFRNTQKGSWFLQALCNELDVNGTNEDILSILTHVNLSVQEHESDVQKYKQILCISSMLTKILTFDVKARKVKVLDQN